MSRPGSFSPYSTEDCYRCHAPASRKDGFYIAHAADNASMVEEIPVGDEFLCQNCTFRELVKRGFQAPPSSRKSQYKRRQNSANTVRGCLDRMVQKVLAVSDFIEGEEKQMIKKDMLAGGGFLKLGIVPRKKFIVTIDKAGVQDGQFGERLNIKFSPAVKHMGDTYDMVTLNKTSLNLVCKKWGMDEEKFVGKKVSIQTGFVSMSGHLDFEEKKHNSVIVSPA